MNTLQLTTRVLGEVTTELQRALDALELTRQQRDLAVQALKGFVDLSGGLDGLKPGVGNASEVRQLAGLVLSSFAKY